MLDTETNASVFAGATAAVLLLSFALAATRSLPIPFALLLLGAIYAIPDGERAIAAPIYAGALLLTGELAYWSLDERVLQRVLAAPLRRACSPYWPSASARSR